MAGEVMSRETRVCLAAFACLSVGVTFNLIFFQGKRISSSVETAAIGAETIMRRAGTEPSTPSKAIAVPSAVEQAVVAPVAPAGVPAPAPAERHVAERAAAAVAVPPPQPSMARADIVRGLQKGLGALGYEPGQPDGVTGLMTRAAIMAYEADNGLALTADPSEELLKRLSNPPAAGRVTRKGPPEVKNIAAAEIIRNAGQWLSALGYPLAKIETGMSPGLVRAIRDFEASQKMPETGRISAPLIARLSRAGSAKAAAR